MKYIALNELEKHIIYDGCDEGCGYIDERDLVDIPTVDLDKIRAEIEALPKTYPFINHFDTYVKEDDVKKIINKYMAESEEA